MEYTVIHGNNRVSQYNSIQGIDRDIKGPCLVLNKSGDIIRRPKTLSIIVWPVPSNLGLQAIVDVKKGTLRFACDGIFQPTEYVVSTYGDSGNVPKPKLKEFISIEDAPPAPHIFDVINYWPEAGSLYPGTKDLPEDWAWKWFGDDWVLGNVTIGLTRADWFKYNDKQVAGQPVETKTITAASMLQSALGHMEDRVKTYDAPGGERSMGKTVSAFNTITGLNLSEEQGWLFMEILKQVRSQQGNYRSDSYEDLIAYAALRGECAARERKD